MQVFEITQKALGPAPILPDIVKADVDGCLSHNLRGKRVALAVGSRGIPLLVSIVANTVKVLKEAGASVFVVPAMGSHGGATALGQAEVLTSLGITSATIGADIRSVMDVKWIAKSDYGHPILVDSNACEADWIIPINRIKSHTSFSGPVESGIMKMLTVGLGKHEGAATYHQQFAKHGFGNVVMDDGKKILDTGKILAAIAIVESDHAIGLLEVIPAYKIPMREQKLLEKAKRWMPRIPFENIDLLIIEEIGKEISGTGMDSNVTGSKTGYPKVKRIYVNSLSPATNGNATGIGLADFCNKSILRQIDYPKTYANCLTSGFPDKAKIPLMFENERECIEAVCKMHSLQHPRIVWIRNTLSLGKIRASEAMREEAVQYGLECGNLTSF